MRKFILMFMGALFITVLCSCNGHKVWPSDDGVTKEYVDSAITQSVQNYINPLFNTVDEVLIFRDLAAEGEAIDEAFNAMPEDVLKNVASVCIKREGHVSKRGIVYEYRANSNVYNNLPSTSQEPSPITEQKDNDGSSAGGQPYRQDSSVPMNETSYTQHDTTIGGKTYKVRTKTEKKYE